jgi:glyoxylase-like metal-dependent hydrolase (beta-lactamase superfamily II)
MLVDTGMDTPAARMALLDGAHALDIRPADLVLVVLTHVHVDHYGLAGLVRDWSGARVVIHETEEQLARRWVDCWRQDRSLVEAELGATGVPADELPCMLEVVDLAHRLYPTFHPDLVLHGEAGQLPDADGWDWILTPGHSPGNICLYHPERQILISGDHVLPRISPNIGADVYATDPLTGYLQSLRCLRDLPAELVLPSHGPPFQHFRERIDDLLAHHDARNDQLLQLLEHPRSAYELTVEVFGPLPPESRVHALRETLAHLVHLRGAGRVERLAGEPETWVASCELGAAA